MRVAVIGAGIVGITTAHRLAREGHKVCVFEQRSTPAEEASFAITGMLGPAYVSQFALGSTPAQWGSDFWSSETGIRLGRGLQGREWSWLWQWLRNRKRPELADERAALLALARCSAQHLADLAHELAWEFERCEGLSVLLRDESDEDHAKTLLETCKALDLPAKLMSGEAIRNLELALNTDTFVQGALHFPNEPTANCRQVALMHKKECDVLGVEFFFDHEVAPLKPGNATIVHARSGDAPFTTRSFDAVVVCAGGSSGALVADVCPPLPEVQVHGYSISAQIREPLNAPRASCYDLKHRVHINRLGQRVRVGGLALLGNPTPAKRLAALKTLYKVLLDWFPGACHMQQVQEWSGARVCTPDGLPIIGAAPERGVWLNMAHGDMGWALAQGCAEGLASMMAFKPADGVDWAKFSPTRFA